MLVSKGYFFLLFILAIRYLVIAGLFFVLFYVLFPNKFAARKIQKLFPANKDYWREIFYSFITLSIFALIGYLLFNPRIKPYFKVYSKISDYGWGYFILSIFIALLIHDMYF